MSTKIFDIAICGAGPVGIALALKLIKRGVAPENLLLMDAKSEAQAMSDQRTIALSYGSKQIFEALDAWPIKATEIKQIHVSRRGYFGRTLIDQQQHQVPALGYVAQYADIVSVLFQTLKRYPGITYLRPAEVTQINDQANPVEVMLADQSTFHAKVFVQAEGGLFGEQAPKSKNRDYQQTAIIGFVRVSDPMPHRAFERFTNDGPLALLPQSDGYALVWCARPQRAEYLLKLNDAEFLSALQTEFGSRMGSFTSCSKRLGFALGLNATTSAPTGNTICIGNAAQTMHPVAGQGLNLGLRDAFQLARFLATEQSAEALTQFYRAQSPDRSLTVKLTDNLARLFSSPSALGTCERGKQSFLALGLGWLDHSAPFQKLLTEHMMFGKRS